MATVQTVRGPVEAGGLGRTLMHEHVFVMTPEVVADYPDMSWEGHKEDRIAEAVKKLTDVKARGIDTIVDLTVLGLGRYLPDVQRVNAEVDINIVAATGYYTYDHLPAFFLSRAPRPRAVEDTDVMTEMFVRDIRDGIGETGVKAAVLKCCTDTPGVTPNIDRVLRAVAQAQLETGVPISTHTEVRVHSGRDQQRIFAEEGVDLTRVVVGHSGDSTDLDYLRELMDRGSLIGCDRFGLYGNGRPDMHERVDTIARLCELGYADRIVLSHDAMCHIDWMAPGYAASRPEWTFTHVPDAVVPALLARGVSQQQVDQMLVDNPRRVLSPAG